MDSQRLLRRFLDYVAIDTQADESVDSYPSSDGQMTLGRLVEKELRELGVEDVELDAHGILWATIPSTADRPVPTIAFCAHRDTSPETSGAGVKPQIIEDYEGGDIELPGDKSQVIRVDENPQLSDVIGHTLITTDGTTLLGADDKAGMAEIVEATAHLMQNPEIPHGEIRLCFTCDEEIGRGVDHLNIDRFGAKVCYTVDGNGVDTINTETFSADMALMTVRGVNIHPSIAKGRMINATRVASRLVSLLPVDHLSPETTDGRDGFMHPYEIAGGVAEAQVRILLRDFETENLESMAAQIRRLAARCEQEFAGAKIEVDIRRQYRNLGDGLQKLPEAIELAELALKRLGRAPHRMIVRGGTDGSRITELGLPTPNLSYGGFNPHSPLEWASLDLMTHCTQWIVTLAQVWAESAGATR